MKKVSGYFSCRPLGSYDYEFYVNDNATDADIREMIEDRLEICMYYEVEEGYEAIVETVYRKKGD